MQTYGLIGHPLGHSFSARFFAEKFEREHIDATYRNFEMPAVDSLRRLIEETPTLCGLNVTIPHKQHVIPLLDSISAEAAAIGAVNVIRITRQDGQTRLKGFNSDVIGFTHSLRPLLCPHHRQALVLGTGGASRAIVHGLRSLQIAPQLVSRQRRDGILSYDDITPELLAAFPLIVNCSPVGMYPHVDEAPRLPYGALTPQHLLYDLVYNPLETAFLRRGREQGAATKNGLEMLELQALASWDFWHGMEQ